MLTLSIYTEMSSIIKMHFRANYFQFLALTFRYYFHMYTNYLNAKLKQTVDQLQNCEDILMNFLVSDITKYPPIKLTQRKSYKDSMVNPSSSVNRVPGGARWLQADHFAQRQV